MSKAAPSNTSISDFYFEVLEMLCQRFMALSPLDILNADMEQVFDLYVSCAIYDTRKKKRESWVTSKTATWY